MESYQPAQSIKEEADIFCTYCIHTPVPAVKSCLHCESSLCDDHLRVHSKAPDHVLCDPTTSFEDRKCSVHKELLKYFCTTDEICVCMSCCLVGGHKGHEVETLEEACKRKKSKLRNVMQNLMTEREEMEKSVQRIIEELEMKSRKIHHIEELCNTTDPLTVLQEPDTGDLCNTEDGHDEDTRDVGGGLNNDGDTHDDGWGRDVAGVSHTLHTGSCDLMSGVNVQQFPGARVSPHSSTEVKYPTTAEPSTPRPQPTPTAQHSHHQARGPNIRAVEQRSGEAHTLHTGTCELISGVNVQECPGAHVSPHSTAKRVHFADVLVHTQHVSSVQHSLPGCQGGGSNVGCVEQTSGVLGVTDILLDVNTAGNNLLISDDRKTATWTKYSQNHPETPQRFQGCPQVLSTQSLPSGRHSWEVDVGVGKSWIVGVCYPSIERRGDHTEIGDNSKSWGLERSRNKYTVTHDGIEIKLPGKVSSKIRIDLDYEAGQISFYDLCDTIRPLHTFTTTFTEPLHLGLYVGRNSSIKILGGTRCESDWWNSWP